MLLIGPFITSEFNTDPLVYGSIVLPAETHYDAVSAVLAPVHFFASILLGPSIAAEFGGQRANTARSGYCRFDLLVTNAF